MCSKTSHRISEKLQLITDNYDDFKKLGVINLNHEVIVPCIYDQIKLHDDINLIEAITLGYDFKRFPGEDYFWSYDYFYHTSHHSIYYNLEGKQVLINKDKKQIVLKGKSDSDVLRERYDVIFEKQRVDGDNTLDYDNSLGLWPVRKNELWGFVDHSGNEVIRCRFYDIGRFNEDRCVVILRPSSSFALAIIDPSGDIIQMSSNFKHISDFSNGRAVVKYYPEIFRDSYRFLESEEREINTNGQLIVKIGNEEKLLNKKYTWYQITEDNLIEVYSEGKYGLLDRNLKQILPCTYDTIRFLDDNPDL